MTVSSTSTFNLTIDDVIDRAYARALGEETTGYDLRAARINLNLLMQDFQVRGTPLWAIELDSINPMLIDTKQYTLDADVVDILDCWTRDLTNASNPDDLIVSRINRDSYAMIPNKDDPGRSYQFYLDRQRDAPVANLYPVVNVASTYALFFYKVRRLYDVGDYSNTMDIPVRWLPALISGLAWYVGRERRKQLGKPWVDDLHKDFEADYVHAANEDVDDAPVRIEIDASAYFGR